LARLRLAATGRRHPTAAVAARLRRAIACAATTGPRSTSRRSGCARLRAQKPGRAIVRAPAAPPRG